MLLRCLWTHWTRWLPEEKSHLPGDIVPVRPRSVSPVPFRPFCFARSVSPVPVRPFRFARS
eukprot:3858067-Karenia_brevis.AAC.1